MNITMNNTTVIIIFNSDWKLVAEKMYEGRQVKTFFESAN